MKTKQASRSAWYNRTSGACALTIVSLAFTYLVASRAIDTGSLQQYFLAFILLIFAINRGIRVARQDRSL